HPGTIRLATSGLLGYRGASPSGAPSQIVARVIFRNFWSFIALTAALSEWLLWQWFFHPDATLVTHLAVITLLLGYNRLAAVALEQEQHRRPVLRAIGMSV